MNIILTHKMLVVPRECSDKSINASLYVTIVFDQEPQSSDYRKACGESRRLYGQNQLGARQNFGFIQSDETIHLRVVTTSAIHNVPTCVTIIISSPSSPPPPQQATATREYRSGPVRKLNSIYRVKSNFCTQL